MKEIIGKRIRQARIENGLTQKALSEELGCSKVMVSRYELGQVDISVSRLDQIATVLRKDPSFFVSKDMYNSKVGSRHYKTSFVFDLDDTLVDGRRFCGETIARVITNLYPSVDFNLVCDIHDSIRGLGIEDLYNHILDKVDIRDPDLDMKSMLKQDYLIQSQNIGKMKLFDGVVEILQFLKDNNKKLYICTNRSESLLKNVLEHNNLSQYFDEVISCIDAGYKKPNPYCLNDLIRRSKQPKENFIYFGDSETDAQFADNAGIDHIIFDQYLNNKNLFKKLIGMFLEVRINGNGI